MKRKSRSFGPVGRKRPRLELVAAAFFGNIDPEGILMIFVSKPDLVYPSSDGKRIAENTLQYEWIVTIEGGFDGTRKSSLGHAT